MYSCILSPRAGTPGKTMKQFAPRSRSLHMAFLATLVLFTGCGSDDPPTRADTPVEPGIPVEVRADANQVGLKDPILLDQASQDGMNLKVKVSYGGCYHAFHPVRALASTAIFETYPLTIDVYLQHDGQGEMC